MKTFLEFDDAGAANDEPVKGVTVGDIRAWHDQVETLIGNYDRFLVETLVGNYDRLLTSWSECQKLLSEEKRKNDELARALKRKLNDPNEDPSGQRWCRWCHPTL